MFGELRTTIDVVGKEIVLWWNYVVDKEARSIEH